MSLGVKFMSAKCGVCTAEAVTLNKKRGLSDCDLGNQTRSNLR